MLTETLTGYAPDSIYAGWSAVERDVADRMEEADNAETDRLLAERVGTDYIGVAGDASLADLTVTYRRQLADLDRAAAAASSPGRRRRIEDQIRRIECEQAARAALAATWLAREDGTHCYPMFHARGGLPAVAHHGARPPSYRLAAFLDRLNWQRGLPHILTWET